MEYCCNFCGACFIENDDVNAKERLKKHQKSCTKDDPFDDDNTADYYDKWL